MVVEKREVSALAVLGAAVFRVADDRVVAPAQGGERAAAMSENGEPDARRGRTMRP
jgi:hypothetical protein